MDRSSEPTRLELATWRDEFKGRTWKWFILLFLATIGTISGALSARDEGESAWFGIAVGTSTVAIIVGIAAVIVRSTTKHPGALVVTFDAITLDSPKVLFGPLRIPSDVIRSIQIDEGSPKRSPFSDVKRFPVIGGSSGSPMGSRIPAWLFSGRGISLRLPLVNRHAITPNVAILFIRPLPSPRLRRRAQRAFGNYGVTTLRYGAEMKGLFAAVRDPLLARGAFERLQVIRPIGIMDVAPLLPTPKEARRARMRLAIGITLATAALGFQIYLSVRPSGACRAADRLLPSRSEANDPSSPSPAEVRPDLAPLLVQVEPINLPGLTYGQPLDLETVAANRPDPKESLKRLRRYGYVHGFERSWGNGGAFAMVYEFSSQANALAFQAYATHYACRYSSDAFAAPGVPGSVGLRIRYKDHVVDQVSTVRGARRYLVGYRWKEPLPTRDDAIAFAKAEDAIAR